MVYVESERTIEVFDSLGVNEIFIRNHLPHFARYVIGNNTAVQPRDSKHCGEYCLYFILHRYLSLDLHLTDLLNAIFGADLQQNEEIVLEFINNE